MFRFTMHVVTWSNPWHPWFLFWGHIKGHKRTLKWRFRWRCTAEPGVCVVPGGGEQISIDTSKGGQCYRDRHHPGKHAQQLFPKCLEQHNIWWIRLFTYWLIHSVSYSNALLINFTERCNVHTEHPAWLYQTVAAHTLRVCLRQKTV